MQVRHSGSPIFIHGVAAEADIPGRFVLVGNIYHNMISAEIPVSVPRLNVYNAYFRLRFIVKRLFQEQEFPPDIKPVIAERRTVRRRPQAVCLRVPSEGVVAGGDYADEGSQIQVFRNGDAFPKAYIVAVTRIL
jgi:hypothetical protein